MGRAAIASLLERGSSSAVLYDAKIAGDVASDTDLAEVIVPAFDSHKIFAEAPWMPRGVTLPAKGDRCIVGLGETDEAGTPEPWILAWWPS